MPKPLSPNESNLNAAEYAAYLDEFRAIYSFGVENPKPKTQKQLGYSNQEYYEYLLKIIEES